MKERTSKLLQASAAGLTVSTFHNLGSILFAANARLSAINQGFQYLISKMQKPHCRLDATMTHQQTAIISISTKYHL